MRFRSFVSMCRSIVRWDGTAGFPLLAKRHRVDAKEIAPLESQLNLWLHLLAFAVYTGSTLSIVLISVPQARAQDGAEAKLRTIAAAMRVYDPLTIAVLGILVMTGAFHLTGYKAAMGASYFEQLGGPLAWKLFFAFLLINVGAYVAFGIGHRLVRTLDWGDGAEEAWVDSMLRRLQASAILCLLLTGAAAWVALQLRYGSL